jgi:hypothetical protein
MNHSICPATSIRWACFVLAAIVWAAGVRAQDQPPAESPFVASLLVVKSDWSKSPFGERVADDVRKATEGTAVAKEVLDRLPASGREILFAPEIASIYSKENFAELLQWLKGNGLVERQSWFEATPEILQSARDRDYRSKDLPIIEHAAHYSQNAGIAGLTDLPLLNTAFVSQSAQIEWTVFCRGRENGVRIGRRISLFEHARGQQAHEKQVLGEMTLSVNLLAKGEVAVVPAFPVTAQSGQSGFAGGYTAGSLMHAENELRHGMLQRGYEVLVVIERSPRAAAGIGGHAAVHLPEKVEVLAIYNAAPSAWSSGGAVAAPAVSAPAVVGQVADGQSPQNQPSAAKPSAKHAASTKPAEGDAAGASKLAGDDANDAKFEAKIKVFALRNLKSTEAERIVRQLFGSSLESMSADERTNSLIVSAPRAWERSSSEQLLNVIYALLTRLDEPELGRPRQPVAGEGSFQVGGTSSRPAGTISELAGKYEQLDGEAKRLARELRELQATPQAHAGPIKELTAQLQKSVAEAFAARQELHQAEVAQLQERVADIQQTLKTRDKLSKEIIDKRVKDLLNPDINWDAAGGGAGGESGAAAGGGAAGGGIGGAVPDAAAGGDGGVIAGAGPAENTGEDYWANVKYGARHGSDADRIWNTLGVKVKPVPRDQLRNKAYPFGAEITEILPGSPADGLKVGDIIVTLGGSAFGTESVLASMLAKPIQNRSVENGQNGQVFEKSEIGVLRDGQTHVFGIKFPLEPPPLEPASSDKDSSAGASGQPPATSRISPAGTVVMSAGDSTVTLRSPDEFRRRLAGLRSAIESTKAEDLKTYAGTSDAERAQTRQKIIDRSQRDLDFLREEYDAQMRLLELEVKDAQSAVEAANREVDRLSHSGVSSRSNEAKRALEAATLKLERGKTLLELYRKADPQQAGEPAQATPPGAPSISLSGGTITLRTPADFREQLRKWQHMVELWKNEPRRSDESVEEWTTRKEEQVQAFQQRLDLARAEYDAQIRLLELEVKDAASAVEAAQSAEQHARELRKKNPGAVAASEVNELQRALVPANVRLERANTLLELYRKADPKQAASDTPAATPETAPAN